MGLDIEKYLAENDYVEIKTGQSGADVYDLDEKMILKHVVRKNIKNDLFDTYCRRISLCTYGFQAGISLQ